MFFFALNINRKSKNFILLVLMSFSLFFIGCHNNSQNNESVQIHENQEINQTIKSEHPKILPESSKKIESERFSTSHPYLFFTLVLVAIVSCAEVIVIIWIVGLPKMGYMVGGGVASELLDRLFEKLFKK